MKKKINYKRYFIHIKYYLLVMNIIGFLLSCSPGIFINSSPNDTSDILNIESVAFVDKEGTEFTIDNSQTQFSSNAVPVTGSLLLSFDQPLSDVDVSKWTNSIILEKENEDSALNIMIANNIDNTNSHKQVRITLQTNLQHNTNYTFTVLNNLAVDSYQFRETQVYGFTTEKDSATALQVSYRNYQGDQMVNPSGNTFTIPLDNENDPQNWIVVTLTVTERASLTNGDEVLTLTDNSLVTNLSFSNDDATYTFTVIAENGVTTETYIL